MRKYSKYVVVAGALAALAAPTAAMADAPNGTFNILPKANANASLVGQDSSQIKQNGQFVSGNANSSVIPDQTTTRVASRDCPGPSRPGRPGQPCQVDRTTWVRRETAHTELPAPC